MARFSRFLFVFIIICSLWQGKDAAAQTGSLKIDLQYFIPPDQISVIFFSDFNLMKSNSGPPIFQVTLHNYSEADKQVVLRFDFLSERFNNAAIVEGKTKPFTLRPGNPITLTNLEITGDTHPDVRLEYFRSNSELMGKLQNSLARIGRLPNDVYTYRLVLEEEQDPGQNNDEVEAKFFIENPTRIDLLGPGTVAMQSDCQQVFTAQPTFRWQGNGEKYILTVCEVLPTNSSPEDVMQNEPRAQLTLVKDKDFYGTPVVVYPATGVWPLVPGKTYYWQVQAIEQSISNEVAISSEIWCFRVAGIDDPTRDVLLEALFRELVALFAGTPFADLLGPNGPLQGYSMTGMFRANGRPISMEELRTLLIELRRSDKKIIDVRVY